MEFVYEEALREYMHKKEKMAVVIEVVTSNCSDFEITELHVHLANKKQADFFKEKKGFKGRTTDCGEVLFPPYRLDYDETIVFGLKSFLGIKRLTYQGIEV